MTNHTPMNEERKAYVLSKLEAVSKELNLPLEEIPVSIPDAFVFLGLPYYQPADLMVVVTIPEAKHMELAKLLKEEHGEHFRTSIIEVVVGVYAVTTPKRQVTQFYNGVHMPDFDLLIEVFNYISVPEDVENKEAILDSNAAFLNRLKELKAHADENKVTEITQ